MNSRRISGCNRLAPRLLLVVGLLFFAPACSDKEPRRLPFPTFDARAPFPELTPGTGSEAAGATGTAAGASASDFEKTIAASMRESDASPEDNAPDIMQRQQVALPGGLVSSIPLDFDEWQWASSDDITVISHRVAGATSPDALIYAEGFRGLIRSFPSTEIRRFLHSVDPALVPSLQPLGKIDPASAVFVPQLNYSSARDLFSGWRWLGHNPARVKLRMARTSGQWQVNEGGGQSAWMLVGSAVVDGDVGTHLAILCKTSPRCPVATELSAFLAELAPADPATLDALHQQGAKIPLADIVAVKGAKQD